MRARSIKPGTFKNEILGTADPLYTILFEGLWCMADRAGRLEDRPLRICAEVFPYRRKISEKRADEMLWWLDENGFIKRYQIGAEQFIEVLEFGSHQNPHKDERPSEIQPFTPDSHRARTVQTRKSHRGKAEVVGLTPSSLTPDSLTPDSHITRTLCSAHDVSEPRMDTGRGNGSEVRNGNGHHLAQPRGDDFDQLQRVKAAYPAGVYPDSDWMLAQKYISQRIEAGYTWDQIVSGCQRFAAQCAIRLSSNGYVESPKKFFGPDNPLKFLEPFPLPAAQERKHPDDTGWRPTE